jgi:hypothetical protein
MPLLICHCRATACNQKLLQPALATSVWQVNDSLAGIGSAIEADAVTYLKVRIIQSVPALQGDHSIRMVLSLVFTCRKRCCRIGLP